MSRFEAALRRWATPGTAVLSVVVGITGVILFFHLAKGPVEAIHEWLGLGFAVLAILHAIRHRGSFIQMLRQRPMRLLTGATTLGVAAFLVMAPSKPSGNPMVGLARAAEQAPISHLAPVLGSRTEDILARLRQAGVNARPEDSLAALAASHHTDSVRLIALALPPAKIRN
ncbi:DUF4405 domain-containing protein [Paramagnetospirillum magnetotacticum]|nr:DUF4405 domain-containing protein [Paramagnetospirillum magnetotacticum]